MSYSCRTEKIKFWPIKNNLFYSQIKALNQTSELVIAYCSENLNWIDKVSNFYDKITIYSKCDNPVKYNSKNVKLIYIKNIGSCDYAYLTYIIYNYNNLPDYVQFSKASKEPIYRKPTICEDCTPYERKKINSPKNPWELTDFKLKNWDFSYNPKMKGKFKFKKSKYKNLYDWAKKTMKIENRKYENNKCNIRNRGGGYFSATKKQINSVPLSVWKKLRKQQKFANEEVDHFIERTWGLLLCDYKE
tara:strand:+ start:1639 stop:2376 length:738 start_codon:yes stop_codon:yes gene_type:complete